TSSDNCCKAYNGESYWLSSNSTCDCTSENTTACCQSDNNPNGKGTWISATSTCSHTSCSGWLDNSGDCCTSENTSNCCTATNTGTGHSSAGRYSSTLATCCHGTETSSNACCKAYHNSSVTEENKYWLGGSTCCFDENTPDCCTSSDNPSGKGTWNSGTNTCSHASCGEDAWPAADDPSYCCTDDDDSDHDCCTSAPGHNQEWCWDPEGGSCWEPKSPYSGVCFCDDPEDYYFNSDYYSDEMCCSSSDVRNTEQCCNLYSEYDKARFWCSSLKQCCSRTTSSDECCKCRNGADYALVQKYNSNGQYLGMFCEKAEAESPEWDGCIRSADDLVKLLDDAGCKTDVYLSSHTSESSNPVKYSVAVSNSPAFIYRFQGHEDYTAPSGDPTSSVAWARMTEEIDTLNDCIKNKVLKNYGNISTIVAGAKTAMLGELGAGSSFGLEDCDDVPDYSYEACEQERHAMINIACYCGESCYSNPWNNYYISVSGFLDDYAMALRYGASGRWDGSPVCYSK
ncbi:hypothetical protein IJ818_02235, partial [bacterium]|nr:hypothetical protein [bacterium]